MNKILKGFRTLALVSTSVALTACTGTALNDSDYLAPYLQSELRSEKQMARDVYRNPQQTLAFFDVKPSHAVVEISPGGGWYTNILAPMLAEQGKLYAAHFYVTDDTRDFYKRSRAAFEEKVKTFAPYQNITVTDFDASLPIAVAPADSSDRVLTFRNVHNWYMRNGDDGVLNAFTMFHNALKSGGVLGVVEHRLPESVDDSEMKSSGYMKQSYVVKMAEQAGFTFVAASEINANSMDTANHPKGVWTLLPRLALGDERRAEFLAIGESDRMTLKFVKN